MCAEKLTQRIARLYRLRKNSLHEGHGFSRAVEYAMGEGFSP